MRYVGGLKVSVHISLAPAPLFFSTPDYFSSYRFFGTLIAIIYRTNQQRDNMTERIEKDCGFLILQDGEIYGYEGGQTDNGEVYKDYEAFKSGVGVCYISEYGLQELHERLTNLEARYENITNPDDLANCGETRQSIIDQIREAYGDDYMLTNEQVEYFASDVFQLADWACIATYLAENFNLDDLIEFDHDYNPEGRRLFSQFQYEAVMNDMFPKEYADRQLSYGELAELDNEFDGAFIVDEDCEDDWSDKGLGANARLTYIEWRRRGDISGPAEFDCPARFRK